MKKTSASTQPMRETAALRQAMIAVAGQAHHIVVALVFAEKEPTRPNPRTIIYTAPPREDEEPAERREIEEIRARYPAESRSWTKWFDRYHQEERALRPLIRAALERADQAAHELDGPTCAPLDCPSIRIKRCLLDLDRLIPSPRTYLDHPPLEIVKQLDEQKEKVSAWLDDLDLLLEAALLHERKARVNRQVEDSDLLSNEEKAIGLFVRNPALKKADIARRLGINKGNVSRMKRLEQAMQAARLMGRGLPRGSKDKKTGRVEGTRDDEESE